MTGRAQGCKIYQIVIKVRAGPGQVADLTTGQDEELSPSEGFDEGEIPFFEVEDRLYLVIRPSATYSNRVCWPYGDQISESLVEFTKRLAVDPKFYHGS